MSPDQRSTLDRIRRQMELRSRVNRFFESAVIFALVELELFQTLSPAPLELEEISRRLGVEEERLARVLRAAVGFDLVQRRDDGKYQIPSELKPFLQSAEAEESLIPWIQFTRSVAPQLFQAAEWVRGGPAVGVMEADFCLRGADLDAFSRAMHLYARGPGAELPQFLDLSQSKSLLDLGCGSGTYAFLLGRQYPHLAIALMDSERVLQVARDTARQFSLNNRVDYLPADVLVDPIPAGHDVILISNLLHLIGPEAARDLLARCFQALPAGGLLAIQGQYLEPGHASRGWPVMLDWILLTSSPQGRNHTASEAADWLQRAGFQDIEFRPMSLVNANRLVVGRKRGLRD